MQNQSVVKRKSFVPGMFKFMIAISSLAGTIGIWNFLANRDYSNSIVMNVENTQTITGVNAPLPTLVPLITVNQSTNASQEVIANTTTTQQVLRQVNAPQVTTSNQIVNSQNPLVIPNPVTNTRTS